MAESPTLLDLFCGAGGAAVGYYRAGFRVIGVDIKPQPRYPFRFVQGDALEYCAQYGHLYDAIHASPPCQAYSAMRRIHRNQRIEHPELIGPTRSIVSTAGPPYIIENVVGAPLLNPVTLCGYTFGLMIYRHRLFESSALLMAPPHVTHTILARETKPIVVYSSATHTKAMVTAMGINWMSRDEGKEAIPPAYTEHLGRQLLGGEWTGRR